MTSSRADRPRRPGRRWTQLAPELPLLIPGLIAVALMLLWAAHDGGFDADTWYWGALVLLGTLAAVVVLGLPSRRRPSRPLVIALIAFAAYVAWSYASIAWAQAPGTALEGSNRALLYLIAFALMALIPWTTRSALALLVTFAVGVGVIALVLILRFASADQVSGLLDVGRLSAPTGYFNANAALFTIAALTATALASRPELPGVLRGLLVGCACAGLQLAVVAQSRGWLFTLPLVLLVAVVIVPDRLRFVATALMPAAATALSAHKLVALYAATSPVALDDTARTAGRQALILCVVMLVLATLLSWAERLRPLPRLSRRGRRGLGAALTVAVLAGGGVGVVAATHGDPVAFVKRQWKGFSHPTVVASHGSYFESVGSGRYDFWRVALDAFLAHPVGGLGQDNFTDYYLPRRHTQEEPAWVHSLELRLLAHTGLVGFLLFATFLVAALTAALRTRRRGDALTRAAAGAGLMALVVWLIHGSVDWFWEMPALSGPALGFLGMTAALAPAKRELPAAVTQAPGAISTAGPGSRRPRSYRPLTAVLGTLALIAATVVLAFPYLSVREVSMATDAAPNAPATALHDLSLAAQLNPLSSDPGLNAGLIALSENQNRVAESRFDQSLSREGGSWLAWLGKGLAQSALGERTPAKHSFRVAYSINTKQPPVRDALRRVGTRHPLTYDQALKLFVIVR